MLAACCSRAGLNVGGGGGGVGGGGTQLGTRLAESEEHCDQLEKEVVVLQDNSMTILERYDRLETQYREMKVEFEVNQQAMHRQTRNSVTYKKQLAEATTMLEAYQQMGLEEQAEAAGQQAAGSSAWPAEVSHSNIGSAGRGGTHSGTHSRESRRRRRPGSGGSLGGMSTGSSTGSAGSGRPGSRTELSRYMSSRACSAASQRPGDSGAADDAGLNEEPEPLVASSPTSTGVGLPPLMAEMWSSAPAQVSSSAQAGLDSTSGWSRSSSPQAGSPQAGSPQAPPGLQRQPIPTELRSLEGPGGSLGPDGVAAGRAAGSGRPRREARRETNPSGFKVERFLTVI